MIPSTSPAKPQKQAFRVWAIVVWLLVWQIAALAIGQEILLVSPVSVVLRLLRLSITAAFWRSLIFSLSRIALGFLSAMACGVVLAGLSVRFVRIRELLAPLLFTVKATPVASFVILALIWVPSRNLSVLIAFLMALPIVYANVLSGIEQTDPQLLEMAALFRVPFSRKLRYIYVSQVLPYFRTACSLALGLCWKSGIAAEVIGLPRGSIGENLYQSKIYLDTPDLFAWTLTIILISVLFEKCFLWVIDRIMRRLEGR